MMWAEQANRTLRTALTPVVGADGVVVATAAVDPTGTVCAPATLPEDRRFEIGSVTKTMTATVLAMLVHEGALTLTEDIGRWLSAGDNGGITVGQLATHTSGLPAVAPNLRVDQADPGDPWAGYGFAEAEAGLRMCRVRPGNPWRYSNLGYHLLGLVLSRVTGQGYPELLAGRLFEPLRMRHSGVGAQGAGTLLPGHADGGELPRAAHPIGAGGVEATIGDLARYAAACLTPPATPLGDALTLAMTPVVPAGEDAGEQALGWLARGGVREHSGGTSGFCACVTIDHDRQRAVAILVNAQGSPARSTHLKHVARLVLAGDDPALAGPVRPWPQWRQAARDLVDRLVAGDIGSAHDRLAAPVRERISRQQLERAWHVRLRPAGPATGSHVTRHEQAATGAVVVDVEIAFPTGSQPMRVIVLPSGEIGGLAFLPQRAE